jgi:hypothetical protein
MASVAGRHAEWLSLLEVNGPFLSMQVLLKAFPQGLDAHDSNHAQLLRTYYDEWVENQESYRSDPAIHRAWIDFVLKETLGFTDDVLLTGQRIPEALSVFVALENETLRPDLVLVNPTGSTEEGTPRLLIQILPNSQGVEKSMENHRWKASPASRMLELLKATKTRLGLVTNGEQWMLVNAPPGESTGYITWTADLWVDEPTTLQAFRSLLSLRRFFGVDDPQTIESLLNESLADQQEVTDQLGYQVRKAVEVFIQAFDRIDQDRDRELLSGVSATFLYEAALTVMMRLVFLLSAEERGLFMLGEEMYDQHYAVSTLRAQLRETADQQGEEVLSRRSDAWCRLLATFRAVYGGVEHDALRLPAYGGNLFDPDRFPFLEGRAPGTNWRETTADPLPISNQIVLHLLEALQILRVKVPGGPPEPRRLSFSALGVEQIGHVYEGLLDHTAVRATSPVLGLTGAKDQESELSLEELERLKERGQKDLVDHLKKITGRQPSTIKRALDAGADEKALDDHLETQRLLEACNNDTALCARVHPWAKILRRDSMDFPVVINPGSLYVTRGDDRRSTGTHYTPPTLTEPIVKYTLEPMVYVGPVEGAPETEWKLRSAKEILDLKVCDMAMGSGAFLVQVCRYLAEKLVESWEDAEATNPGAFIVTPEGKLSTGSEQERLLPADVNERILIARRYVADKCLYGVDKNPLAVEMAKLSLWLVTLRRDRPFTFLDHALKCGDSLLGVSTVRQIENFSLREDDQQITFATSNLFRYIEEASAKRVSLEQLSSDGHEQIEMKTRLLAEAEAATAKVKALADLLIAFELGGFDGNQYDTQRTIAANQAELAMRKQLPEFQVYARQQLRGRRAFHWPVEFPEVFSRGGFDAYLGNPPFYAGAWLRTLLGEDYRKLIVSYIAEGRTGLRGTADLCVYFVLRARALRRQGARVGLILSSTVCEGDSKAVGINSAIQSGSTVYVTPSRKWPGQASVEFVSLWLSDVPTGQTYFAQSVECKVFGPAEADSYREPHPLAINRPFICKGHELQGDGFKLQPSEATHLLSRNTINRDVIFPILTGEVLNNSPTLQPQGFVINFGERTLDEAERYGEPLDIVRKRVKPERDAYLSDTGRDRFLRTYWWLFRGLRSDLEKYSRSNDRMLVSTVHTKYIALAFIDSKIVVTPSIYCFLFRDYAHFAVLQSSFHEAWATYYASSLGETLRYIAGRCFNTFPLVDEQGLDTLQQIGREFYEHRSSCMVGHDEGLTDLYNRFHLDHEKSEDILRLRILQVEMDQAVAAAYGWSDLDLGHGFHEAKQGVRFTISEPARREVLDRVLQLNHERYAEEVRPDFHDKKRGKVKRKEKSLAGAEPADSKPGKPQLFD